MNAKAQWMTIKRDATTTARQAMVEQATGAADVASLAGGYDIDDPRWYTTATESYNRQAWAGVGLN